LQIFLRRFEKNELQECPYYYSFPPPLPPNRVRQSLGDSHPFDVLAKPPPLASPSYFPPPLRPYPPPRFFTYFGSLPPPSHPPPLGHDPPPLFRTPRPLRMCAQDPAPPLRTRPSSPPPFHTSCPRPTTTPPPPPGSHADAARNARYTLRNPPTPPPCFISPCIAF